MSSRTRRLPIACVSLSTLSAMMPSIRPCATAMSPLHSPARQAASDAEPRQRLPRPRLNPEMGCDAAFRVIGRRFIGDLAANHEATCRGDPAALHQMRIALTHLRTAILFFSPMVVDSQWARIKRELKWLNGQLGTVRDLDVAIERLNAASKQRPQAIPHYQDWNRKRADSHRHLARALRSARYRRLVEDITGWVENGPWSIKKEKQTAQVRASPIVAYSAQKLTGWREKLQRKCRKLPDMGTKKRHRLRLLNKRISYSIGFFEDLFPDKRFSRQKTALNYLRKAQKSLGQLNDDANGHSLATELQRDGIPAPLQFLSDKREKRLIRTALAAYQKLAAVKPFRA
jgi:CHAD domain-containing protein